MPYTIQGFNPFVLPEPVPLNNFMYVPVRDLTGALGGAVEWDPETEICTIVIAPWTAVCKIDATTAEVCDTPIELKAPIVVIDGSVWAPAEFYHDVFGFEISVDGANIAISNPNVTTAAT